MKIYINICSFLNPIKHYAPKKHQKQCHFLPSTDKKVRESTLAFGWIIGGTCEWKCDRHILVKQENKGDSPK